MPRFFVGGGNIAGGIALVGGRDAEHIHVLRMKVGDHIVLCDGRGTDYNCRIRRMADGVVEAEVEACGPSVTEPTVSATILAGIPKGERADYIVQKTTETGAESIGFFSCERCVARPDERALEKKLQRWQRIAEEAAKQCGRGRIPQVFWAGSFQEALALAKKSALPLFCYETGERESLRAVLSAAMPILSAAILTGPEGGFTPQEAEEARAAGMTWCSLGTRIFRCETAPVVALAALMYETGNL